MRYWIDCERGRFEPEKYPEEARLYRLLRDLVQSEKFICPLCYPVFAEVMRSSPTSRDRLATVVDELGLGVTLEPPEVLLQLELRHWVKTIPGLERPVYPRVQLAWNRASHVCGISVPQNPNLIPETMLAIQKKHYDSMEQLPFPLLIKQLNFAGEWPQEDYSEYAAKATADQERHREDFRNFAEVFNIEITGGLDACVHDLGALMTEMYVQAHPNGVLPSGRETQRSGQMLVNLLREAFRLGKLHDELPFVHIGAGLHALVRYRREKVHKGDIHDFMHARVALPYCNYFFTEKRLGNLLTNKLLKFDEIYDCRVLWKTGEILCELEKLFDVREES